MEKYHINPETGKPNHCTATIKCKYAKDGVIPEHYDTEEDARKAYEQQNLEKEVQSFNKHTGINEQYNPITDEGMKYTYYIQPNFTTVSKENVDLVPASIYL